MTVALGADHRGFRLKESLKEWLAGQGHRVLDFGTGSADSADYPDHAFLVGEAVAARRARRGILLCGSGIGMSIAANKVTGVRAALCLDERMAVASREHNDANVLCLAADRLTPARARRIVAAWLATKHAGGRHRRRVGKIRRYERKPAAGGQ
jgi:ribose 5-phosphate isomerase B